MTEAYIQNPQVGLGAYEARLLERGVHHFIISALKPLNRSQRPNAISKITIGKSNQDALTVVSKWGKTMKAKAQITHHADEITPKAANALGIYLDLNHR